MLHLTDLKAIDVMPVAVFGTTERMLKTVRYDESVSPAAASFSMPVGNPPRLVTPP